MDVDARLLAAMNGAYGRPSSRLASVPLLDREWAGTVWILSTLAARNANWKLSWLFLLDRPGIAVPGSGLPGYAWKGNANDDGGGRGV